MKPSLSLLAASISVAIICTPIAASGLRLEAAASPIRALAPSQRDINIAILAVIAGNLLIGYERVARQHSAESKTRDRSQQATNSTRD
jgi:hypothetical protein